MSYSKNYVLLSAAALLFACKQNPSVLANASSQSTDSISQSEKKANKKSAALLIPIDRNDKGFPDGLPADVVTPGGWAIRYLVKDDDTKYDDLYIECSKGNSKVLIPDRFLNVKLIPRFSKENETHLFLGHKCGAECMGLTTVSKEQIPVYQTYEMVLDYDVVTGQVVYTISDNSTEDSLKLMVVNVALGKEKRIAFDNVPTHKTNGGVDSIVFKNKKVLLYAGLIDRNDPEEEDIVKESRTVSFDK